MNIKIIGNGEWGNALYKVIKHNYPHVSIWDRKEKLDDIDIIVLSIPTQNIREAIMSFGLLKNNVIIINSAKGIERNTHKLPFEIVKDLVKVNYHYFSLIGPSFAEEVISKMPTLVNLGYIRKGHSELLKNIFQTDYFRVRLTEGVRSLELAGAFKNVYAIACGIADGLGFGVNTRIKLILLAIDEFYSFCRKLGYKINTQSSPGTIGDLVLTCSSTESRNFSFGKLLAKNHVQDSFDKLNKTIEGYHTTSSIQYFVKKYGLSLPLATFISDTISLDDPQKLKERFLKFVKNT